MRGAVDQKKRMEELTQNEPRRWKKKGMGWQRGDLMGV
jgi:hypothetical protein